MAALAAAMRHAVKAAQCQPAAGISWPASAIMQRIEA